ncbi:MAG UNVERIFIED_CONTAM: hypothetical protein LVQ98_03105 [Rickettsiaceae bacterium]
MQRAAWGEQLFAVEAVGQLNPEKVAPARHSIADLFAQLLLKRSVQSHNASAIDLPKLFEVLLLLALFEEKGDQR